MGAHLALAKFVANSQVAGVGAYRRLSIINRGNSKPSKYEKSAMIGRSRSEDKLEAKYSLGFREGM